MTSGNTGGAWNAGGAGGARNAGGGNGTHRICMHCGHYKSIQKLGATYKYRHASTDMLN